MNHRIFLSIISLLFSAIIASPVKIPQQNCSSCGGTGRNPWTFTGICGMCYGKGHVDNPYEIQSCIMGIIDAKCDLMDGHYSKALSKLTKMINDYDHEEAMFYLAYMYELGMGVSVDTDHAMRLFNASSERGFKMAKEKIKHIRSNGFINPTERARQNLMMWMKDQFNMATMMCNSFNPNFGTIDSNSGSNSSHSNHSSGICSECGGTRVLRRAESTCAASLIGHYNPQGYDCPYCNRIDQHWHMKCPKCCH